MSARRTGIQVRRAARSGIAQRARLPRWHAANRVTASAAADVVTGARLAFIAGNVAPAMRVAQFMYTCKRP
jgi:hypothetical protein